MKTKWMMMAAMAMAFTPAAHAEEGRIMSDAQLKALYPTTQEIYEDCKAAVKLYETDKKGFMMSGCAARINGVIWGGYLIVGRVQSYYPEDSIQNCAAETQRTWQKVLSAVQNSLCIPTKTFPQDHPLEFSIARDVINYLENNEKIEKSQYVMAGIIESLYSCKELNKESNNGLDN